METGEPVGRKADTRLFAITFHPLRIMACSIRVTNRSSVLECTILTVVTRAFEMLSESDFGQEMQPASRKNKDKMKREVNIWFIVILFANLPELASANYLHNVKPS